MRRFKSSIQFVNEKIKDIQPPLKALKSIKSYMIDLENYKVISLAPNPQSHVLKSSPNQIRTISSM